MKKFALFIILTALMPVLSACCDCPYPARTTTVVNPPPNHAVIVTPAD